jgi:MFS family permease
LRRNHRGRKPPETEEMKARQGLPRSVWALGFVSMLMDMSTETIHSLLPLFVVIGLGAGATMFGLIEGVAEATANLLKPLSGRLSDRFANRKGWLLAGYGLAALSKPLFPVATSAAEVFFARMADRFGKGLRIAPRDALVADVTPANRLGAAYGLRQSLDTVGAVTGPAMAVGFMALTGGDVRSVFWLAVVPAVAAVVVLQFGVREPHRAAPPQAGPTWRWRDMLDFAGVGGRGYWLALSAAVLLNVAKPSEGFMILRAADVGVPLVFTPTVLIAMNLVYALSSYPAGLLSDAIGRTKLLELGIAILVASQLVMAMAPSVGGAFVGAALWGLHLGLSQGLLAVLVAEATPAETRGAAFGLFHFAAGLALIPGSVIAGMLWDAFGAQATFLVGAGLGLAPLMILVAARPAKAGLGK